ncbi:MAG: YhdP family protein [Burkholderiaceae bacterium]
MTTSAIPPQNGESDRAHSGSSVLRAAWSALAWSLVALFFVFGALVLTVRYAILPSLDEWRPRIERIASNALKAPVSIGQIDASWRGLNPHLALSDVRVTGRGGERGLSLPNVEGTLSWFSVLALEPRFSLLRIDAPELDVTRLSDDEFRIAGLAFDLRERGEGPGVLDWILAQGEVAVRDARINYIDQRRDAAALELTHVNLQLENLFGSHMFGMQAVPTSTIAAPIDVRARFRHSPFDSASDFRRWTGEVFAAVDFADLAAIARIFDAPLDAERAQGAVRTWITFDQARLTRAIADVALTDVNVKLASDLQPLVLASLQGRVSQRRWGEDDGSGGNEFEGKQLALVTPNKRAVAPFDVKVRTTRAKGNVPARTDVQASRVDLQDLAWVTTHVPIARAWREMIAKHRIEGTLYDVAASWPGSTPDASSMSLKTRFERLASAAQPATIAERHADEHALGMPGFENLSGSLELVNGAGSMQLASKDATLFFPGVFNEPRVRLTKLDAAVRWKPDPALEIQIASASAANADIELNASGVYRAAARNANGELSGPGWLDLTARVARLHAPAAFKYVPAIAGSETIGWLQHALIAGRVTDGAVRVRGDLAHFPFDRHRDGEMRVTARVHDATLDVQPAAHGDRTASTRWPLLTGIDAELLFDRASMTITAPRGAAYGARLSNTVAHMAELGKSPLEVHGIADGPLADMLRYVNSSPVAAWIGGVTNNAQASGDAKLNLRLAIPLHDASSTKVAGSLQFANNELMLADAPPFSRVAGTLNFTENSLNSNNLSAMTLGGQARIEAATKADHTITLTATGIATVPGVRRAISIGPVQQLLDRSQGSARYTATLTINPAPELKIESDLIGVAIDGIVPLTKTVQESMPLRIERIASSAERDELRVNAGRALAIRFERRREQTGYRVTRGVIALNEEPNLPQSGVLVLANVPRLDVEAWSALLDADIASTAAEKTTPDMQIDLLAIRAQELIAAGRTFRNVTLGASRAADGYNINVVSDGVAGHIEWRPQQITARLSRMSIPATRKTEVVQALHSAPKQLPTLDITAEQFELSGLKLGRLDLQAQNIGPSSAPAWRISRFDITNADMKLTSSGDWAPDAGKGAAARRVSINFKLDAHDAGATLDRLGFAGAMASGQGSIDGDIQWLGSPLDIDYPTLSGKLALSLDNGRFLKVDGGNAARLLSLLSLQSLSRTLLFDGGRQFAEGFAYNSIRADATIAQGVISTNNFRMSGASAAVLMSGTIDLRNETQQLHLVVLPEIDASTAALALGVANPILGIGAFLAQYVLRNPLSKAFALEYDISGTWAQPQVTRRGRAADMTEQMREQVR